MSEDLNPLARNATFYRRLRRWRRLAAKAQGGLCHHCKVVLAPPSSGVANACTADHLVALADGGKHARANVVAACFACNNARGSEKARAAAEARLSARKRPSADGPRERVL
ncbi:MAG: HNH endonuclease [Hyphomonadaceae bacterium]|nr:HNH endonuclease [Hyphomonadaceae bacterium]